MIAALYVMPGGCYYGLEGVDPWDEARDARRYTGPWPVVAHPPCERWGQYATGGPNPAARRRIVGDDGGCFAAALASVRRWGGVLEHPRASKAWARFSIPAPPHTGGWVFVGRADGRTEWTCHVEQRHYGHRARKATWLFAVLPDGVSPPSLVWGEAEPGLRLDAGFHSKEERAACHALDGHARERMGKRERTATPVPFRDLLISIARMAQ
jgi:hypothetical protein